MKNEIIRAIEDLSLATATAKGHDEAMKYAQAVLNLANALVSIEGHELRELREQREKRELIQQREDRKKWEEER
jgi:hypothetical protein